jgi:hypothetical protein
MVDGQQRLARDVNASYAKRPCQASARGVQFVCRNLGVFPSLC